MRPKPHAARLAPYVLAPLALASGPTFGDRPEDERAISTRGELLEALERVRPGDELRLAADAVLRGGIELRGIRGTPGAPIRLVAADAERPPRIEGGASGLHLVQCSYLVIDGLHLCGASGNGLNADDGGPGHAPPRGIVLRNLVVTDVGPHGNCDGIKLSGLEDFQVENCRIERWGTGGSGIDLVGCRDGRIDGCVLARDPEGQTRAQASNGVQIKGGSARIAVSGCTFRHAGGRAVNLGGSTGMEHFRPREARAEAAELTVEDCTFVGGGCAVAFVGVDGARVRHNTIYRPERWVLRILQENRESGLATCRAGEFSHNIVVFRASELAEALNIGPHTAPETFAFAGNVWFCEDDPQASRERVRLPVPETEGVFGVDPQLCQPPQRLERRPGSPIEKAGARRP